MKNLNNVQVFIYDDESETRMDLVSFLQELRKDVDMMKQDIALLEEENIGTTNTLYELENKIDMLSYDK